MADEKPTLHIDTDWKRQAQEEKKKLAEQEAKKAAEVVAPAPSAAPEMGRPMPGRPRGQAQPAASFAALVNSMLAQTLYYLGELTSRGNEPQVNLDMAKHQIDTLAVLDEKTRGNLTEDEQKMLDTALYEVRMRYVSVASQYT